MIDDHRVVYVLELAPDSGSGSVFVDGSTNGRTAVSVELEVVKRNGRLTIVTKTLDLTNGTGRRATFAAVVRGSSVSFLQNRGVRPGTNELSFAVERHGDVKLRRARILGGSGLVVTRRSPAKLDVEPRLPRMALEVGERAKVGYRLENTGDRPAMDVSVGLQSDRGSLPVVGASQVRVRRLDRSRTGAFVVEARRPGTHRLVLAAGSSNAGNPMVELAVDIPEKPSEESSVRAGWVVGSVLAGVGLVVFSASRWSRRRRPA